MKISTYGTPAAIYTFESSEFTGDKDAHFNVTFQATTNGYGVTEAGSSGSPLYNEKKLVVGTLTGGNSSCTYSKGLNIYGRMYYHWDKYNNDAISRMDVWFDPLNSGVETLQGRYREAFRPAPVNLRATNQGQGIYLEWEAPNGASGLEKYYIYRNNQRINETISTYYLDTEPMNGSNTYSISAVYAGDKESQFVTNTINYIKYLAPTNLKAERTSISRVKVSWEAPIYEQTIYWGSLNISYEIGFEDNKPFYFGQLWQPEDISPLHARTIKAVQFVPVEKNTYEIYIKQDERVYRQYIAPVALNYLDINTINLTTPFVIDGNKSLTVAIYVSTIGTDYPAVCDNGPARDGKGNIFSPDGVNWEKLYEPDKPDDFNYNFIVTAIISSNLGSLPQTTDNTLKKNSIPFSGKKTMTSRSAAINHDLSEVSLRSSQPVLFPEVGRYKVYRTGSAYKLIDSPVTSFIESTESDNFVYEASAIYGDIESVRSNKAYITIVNVENVNDSVDILPSTFSNSAHLKGVEYTTRIDVFSASGKMCFVIENPSNTIDTSSLSQGVYFFRIYGNNKVLKVVRAIKIN
jgi:hypothetical protein